MRFLIFLAVFLLIAGVTALERRGDDDDDDDGNNSNSNTNVYQDKADVVETLNNYVINLNRLVEYAPGPSCDYNTVNQTAHAAAASDLINKFFSPTIRAFVVVQTTHNVPGPAVVSNISLGSPATDYSPAITSSAVLHAYLKNYYVGFSGRAFSSPFHWLLSAPVVTIKNRDQDYGGRKTAHVIANNENKGYMCSDSSGAPNRVFRLQFSLYRHVFVRENNQWKFVHFGEDNKNTIYINDLTQFQPNFA